MEKLLLYGAFGLAAYSILRPQTAAAAPPAARTIQPQESGATAASRRERARELGDRFGWQTNRVQEGEWIVTYRWPLGVIDPLDWREEVSRKRGNLTEESIAKHGGLPEVGP